MRRHVLKNITRFHIRHIRAYLRAVSTGGMTGGCNSARARIVTAGAKGQQDG